MKMTGIIVAVPGVIMAAIGFIWGWVVGFYPSELPWVIALVAGGGLLAWLGFKLMNRDEDAATAATAAPRAPVATASAAPSGPRVTHATSAAELAELAVAHPQLWPAIEAHRNAYPDLVAWIAQTRATGATPAPVQVTVPRESASAPVATDAAAKVADPATTPTELAELAASHPELRSAIAEHPAAYPALKEWIANR